MSPSNQRQMRYCSGGFVQIPIGNGEVLVRCPATNTSEIVSLAAAQVLARCKGVATLPEHAERIAAEGHGTDTCSASPSLHSLLEALVNKQLLLPYDQFIQLVDDAGSDTVPPIAWFAIPTRNRPNALKRALDTYIPANLQHHPFLRYCIIDFSDPWAAQNNLAILLECKRSYGVDISYSGVSERRHFAAALSGYGRLEHNLVGFALGDVSTCLSGRASTEMTFHGACYNTLLLQSAGQLALIVDDDTISRLWPSPDSETGLVLSSLQYAWSLRPFDHAEALMATESTDKDLVSVHEELLGRAVGSCVRRFAEAELLSCPEPSEFVGGFQYAKRRILLTMAGLVGDCGTESSTWWLFQHQAESPHLTHSETTYRATLKNRNIVRSVPRLTVAPIRECMSFNLGLDNRDCLPPFMPVQRNEDGLFAQLLRICYPEGYAGLLPYVLLHSPLEIREFSPAALFTQGTEFRVCDILLLILSSLRLPGGPGCSRMNLKCAGQFLSALAAARPERLAEVIRFQLWAMMGHCLQVVEQKITANTGLPSFWLEDLFAYAEIQRSAMLRDHLIVPTDLQWVGTEHDSLAVFQRLLSSFGQLLAVWPEVVESSRELASRGISVARRL